MSEVRSRRVTDAPGLKADGVSSLRHAVARAVAVSILLTFSPAFSTTAAREPSAGTEPRHPDQDKKSAAAASVAQGEDALKAGNLPAAERASLEQYRDRFGRAPSPVMMRPCAVCAACDPASAIRFADTVAKAAVRGGLGSFRSRGRKFFSFLTRTTDSRAICREIARCFSVFQGSGESLMLE